MRSEGAVRHQLKQVLFRHLQKELRANFRQIPVSCRFNRQSLLEGTIQHGVSVGVCYFEVDGKPRKVVCDARLPGGSEQARNCPLWSPHRDKETVKQEFRDLMASGDYGMIAAKYPDVTALMWVLGVSIPEDLGEVEAEVDKDEGGQEP
jgi:hypothetical protein